MSSPFDTDQPVIVHFVIESKKNEEEYSDDMKMAFQVCSEQNLNPKWITEEACLQCNPSKTDVYVFQDFKGDSFQFLKSFACDCIVIGPRCILDCIRAGTLIPKGNTPLFTVAMRNLVITTTGFMGVADDLKASIIEKVQYMGGTYCAEYRQSVTHLVAYKILSEKYELAQENRIPVMTEEWISAVWDESQRRNVHASDNEFLIYKCPIFHKMVITCSQLPRKMKEAIRWKIDNNGGEFSGQLQSNKTTLLIVMSNDGEKYHYAKTWNLPCVKPSWIMDSVEIGYALPLEKYLLEGSEINVKVSTPEATVVPLPDCSMSYIQGVATRIGETMLDNTTSSVSVSPRVGQYMKLINDLNMSHVKKAGAFLDGCNVYLSGFNPEYTEKLRRVLNSGGAIRFNEISETVTHVIVGDFVPSDIKDIKSCESRLHVVTVQWLIESVRLRSVAPEDKFSCYDALPSPIENQSPLSKKGLLVLHNSQNSSKHVRCLSMNSPVSRKENLEPRNLVQQYQQASPSTSSEPKNSEKSGKENTHEDKKDDDNNDISLLEAPNRTSQQCRSSQLSQTSQNAQNSTLSPSCTSTLSQTDIFKGLTFSLAGFSSGEARSVENLIRSGAGQVVRQNFTGIPDYGVVPILGASLKHTTTEVVSFYWVEECLEDKQLHPVQYYHLPITLDTEQHPLAGCVMSITSYLGMERRFLSVLIELLGGLNQAMFARIDHPEHDGRASTHLICPDDSETKSSRKFKAALKWGIPPVSHMWLLACAKEGKKVDEHPYSVVPDGLGTTTRVSTPQTPAGSLKRKLDDSEASNFATPKPYDSSQLAQPGPSETPTFSTPKPPGYVATPETPYGQVFEDNPSPNTRKEWKKWINQFPEYPQYQCSPPKQRRLSTPLSELKRQCWEKFGAGFCGEAKNTKEDEDCEIEEVPESEKANEVVKNRVDGPIRCEDDSLSEKVPEEVKIGGTPGSQNFTTPGHGAGINTQLLELDKILDTASKRNQLEGNTDEVEESAERKPPGHHTAPETLDVCGDMVEWVDPAISNKSEKADKVEKTFLFMLTSLDNREYYEDVIRSLGGVVSTKQVYEKDSTHLVCLQPSRSEKLLSCIAAGKWVLDKTYLEDSKEAGHFLEEETYEWGNPKAASLMTRLKPGSLNHQLALAVYRWRCRVKETGVGAFAGVRAIVCSSPEKIALYSRLIEAGGGEVLDISPPYSDPGNATLCIIEFAKVNCRLDLASLARHNVPCVPAMYINNYLIDDPPPEPSSCLIAEYETVLSTL